MFDLYDLGTLPGDTVSFATAVNASHQVVGTSSPSTDVGAAMRAFHWSDGVMTDIGNFGGSVTKAWDINASGEIVGSSQDANGKTRAFRWTKKDGMVDLGLDSEFESIAVAINDAGVIVGLHYPLIPFYRDAKGAFVKLPQNVARVGGTSNLSGVAALNAAGCMTGQADDGIRTYFWDPLQPGTARFTPTPPFWSEPAGMNSHRVIVGAESGSVWIPDPSQEAQSPPFNLTPFTSGSFYYASDINDSSTIVGGSFSGTGDGTAIVWFSASPTTPPIDLNLLVSGTNKMHLRGGRAINNLGSIVGEGTVSGFTHAYLAKVREPEFNFHTYGTFVNIVVGAAGGRVIGVTLDGHVVHFPEPNPILRNLENAYELLANVQSPTERSRIENEIARAIEKQLRKHRSR